MITISLASRQSFDAYGKLLEVTKNQEMTVIDQIFHKVAEIAIPHFFITVEFSASGTEMPEHIEAFLQEKYEVILRGASGRKFIYKEGEWRLIFTFFPTDRVVDERYALKNKVQMINKVQMKSKS